MEARDTVYGAVRSPSLRMAVHCVERKAECLKCAIMRINLNESLIYAFLSKLLNQLCKFALPTATTPYSNIDAVQFLHS